VPHIWQKINAQWHSCHWWHECDGRMITAMNTVLIILLVIAVAAVAVETLLVTRHDDRGTTPPPPSHATDLQFVGPANR
jgi:hypothetical protein